MTQAQTVMNHLWKKGTINSVEAIGLYGITRLAAVIDRLKRDHHAGSGITSRMKKGVRANYAEYSLKQKAS